MAKLILPEGAKLKIEGYSIVRSGNELRLRRTGTISKHRYASDPRFARMRENGAEFGRAAKASKLIRNALLPLKGNTELSKLSNRLNKKMLEIIKLDQVHGQGHRRILMENIGLLCGFELNQKSSLRNNLYAQLKFNVNQKTGEANVKVLVDDPSKDFWYPENATHVVLSLTLVSANFQNETSDAQHIVSQLYSLKESKPLVIDLGRPLEHQPDNIILAAMAVRFYKAEAVWSHSITPSKTSITIIMAGDKHI